MIRACEAHGLPLLELPPEVPFVLIMRHVGQAIAAGRHEELRKGWELAGFSTVRTSAPCLLAWGIVAASL